MQKRIKFVHMLIVLCKAKLYIADIIIAYIFSLFAQHKRTKKFVSERRFWQAINVLDYKFLFIPVVFTVLRIWSCIMNVLFVYSDVGYHLPKGVTIALIYLSVSELTSYICL